MHAEMHPASQRRGRSMRRLAPLGFPTPITKSAVRIDPIGECRLASDHAVIVQVDERVRQARL